MMYTEEELKKIKISIKRPNIIPLDNNEQLTDYSFSIDEQLPIHINPSEGTKPLFHEEFTNRIRTPSVEKFSRLSDLSSLPSLSSDDEIYEIENVLGKLDNILKEVKGKTKEAKKQASYRNRKRRSRSRNSSQSEYFNSPKRKRMRRDSEYSNRKYDRPSTSRHNIEDNEDHVERKREHRSSNNKYSRKHDSSYRKSGNSKRSDERRKDYDHDYYSHESYYHDMKERYARYYTVMYAFNIIMDILRKDDLYNSHY